MNERDLSDGKQKRLTLNIMGPRDGLGIHINGLYCGSKTPSKIVVAIGDLVHAGWISMGAWVVQGDEKAISFHREPFQHGHRLFVDTGHGKELIGYKLDENISQSSFEELIKGTAKLRVLHAGECHGIDSIKSLATQTDIWALSLYGTNVKDILTLANLKKLRILDLMNTKINISEVAILKEQLPLCTIYADL